MTLDRSRRARAARKRRHRFLAADNDLTLAQWTAIRAAWGGCAYCGEFDTALQKDCVLPLSRGGRYIGRERRSRVSLLQREQEQ